MTAAMLNADENTGTPAPDLSMRIPNSSGAAAVAMRVGGPVVQADSHNFPPQDREWHGTPRDRQNAAGIMPDTMADDERNRLGEASPDLRLDGAGAGCAPSHPE